MLYFFSGNDSQKIRAAVDAAIVKNTQVVRVSDASSLQDLQFALSGGGMFAEKRTVILSTIFSSDAVGHQEYLEAVLPVISKMSDVFILVETDIKADARKKIEKYAEKSEKFEVKKAKEYPTVFALVDALKKKDKKALWVGYQKELLKGNAAEMILGTLFWGAKKMSTEARSEEERLRAEQLLIHFVELPHEARRRGEELEYALEQSLLSIA